MRIRSHSACAVRQPVDDFGKRATVGIEELRRSVRPHPCLELREVLGFLSYLGERDLVRAPCAFDRKSVNLFWPGPSLRRSQHDHWPPRPGAIASLAGALLDRSDLGEHV